MKHRLCGVGIITVRRCFGSNFAVSATHQIEGDIGIARTHWLMGSSIIPSVVEDGNRSLLIWVESRAVGIVFPSTITAVIASIHDVPPEVNDLIHRMLPQRTINVKTMG